MRTGSIDPTGTAIGDNRRVTGGGATATDGRVRVLWLVRGLGPGGAERLLVLTAQMADHDRFSFRVGFTRADKTMFVEPLAGAGVPSYLIGSVGDPCWLWNLRGLLATTDVVHAHSPLLAGVARLVARTLPPRHRPFVVSTEHNEWGNFGWPTRLLNAVTAPLDHHRWAVSEGVRVSMWGPLSRGVEVLVQGIAPGSGAGPDSRARLRTELAIDEDSVLAVTVANYRREKDYPNLLRAARRALADNPRLVMAAVGQGHLEDEVLALHDELGLGDRFRLLGYRRDVPAVLAAADLFVLGSVHEGLPVAVMEAMAAGLPVVATAVGGVPEAVADGVSGLVVPPRNADALADAVTRLVTEPELRARMGAAAAAASTRFDIRTAVARQQQIYAELVRRGR